MSEPEAKKTRVEEGEGAAAVATPMKKAIITGITGQDGSYLAEFLLEKVRSRCIIQFCDALSPGGGSSGFLQPCRLVGPLLMNWKESVQ